MIYPSWTYRSTKAPTLPHGAFNESLISYCSLSGLANEEASKQVEALNLCFSRETLAVVQNLGLTDDDRKDVTAIIEAFTKLRR